jgi:preprotein translocase subunit SecF
LLMLSCSMSAARQVSCLRMPPQKGHDSNISDDIQKAANFDPANPATLKQVESVGSQVGGEMYLNSLLAIGLSLALMAVYVGLRFRFKLAFGAVVSLVHDVLFTVGAFAIFGWPFDLTVLAAVLALIGYSLNDTIVIFDRVRENFPQAAQGRSAGDRGYFPDRNLASNLHDGRYGCCGAGCTAVAGRTGFAMVLGGAADWYVCRYLFLHLHRDQLCLMMGLDKEDFIEKPKSELVEETFD